jgi:beta-fructofuranosidase
VELRDLDKREYPDLLEDQLKVLESDASVSALRESRKSLAADPFRPLYHFSSPGGVMNDPNGLCRWRGRWHLFYQFRPQAQDCVHWGHAVSDDLMHWRDLPVAIYPGPEKDCYSGQSLVERDRVVAVYHGTESGNDIATASDPLLLNWKKHPDNPVIPIVPIDGNGRPYRVFDPCIWKEADGYYTLSGVYWAGERRMDCLGVAHVFRSRDLVRWEHVGPLIDADANTEPGEDYAVPNFWPIGDSRHMMLFFSHKRAGQYYVGRYDQESHRLIPELHGRMNYGPIGIGSLHAPSATVDDQGRYLAIFNVKEGKPAAGWDNVMTLPRHLSLAADHTLRIEPVAETAGLRREHATAGPLAIPANREIALNGIRGKTMEIEAVLDIGGAREAGLCVLRSPGGEEGTRISFYDKSGGPGSPRNDRPTMRGALQIDVSVSSLLPEVFARTPETGPLNLGKGEPLRLRVFIDRSIIEVFANGSQCLTLRAYPGREDSSGVSVFARGGEARLLSLSAWQMSGIWPELRHLEGR